MAKQILSRLVAANIDTDELENTGGSLSVGRIEIIAVIGELYKYANEYGIANYADIQAQLLAAVNNAEIDAILMYFDSPGGLTTGLVATSKLIRDIRQDKPVIGYISGMCASAAYVLASQCDILVAEELSEIGSIGVMVAMVDSSEQFAKAGKKLIVNRSGERKGQWLEGLAIPQSEIDSNQRIVDSQFAKIKSEILAGRPALSEAELDAIATGEIFNEDESMERKLIDQIGNIATAMSVAGNSELAGTKARKTKGKVKAEAKAEEKPEDEKEPVEAVEDEADAKAEDEPVEAVEATESEPKPEDEPQGEEQADEPTEPVEEMAEDEPQGEEQADEKKPEDEIKELESKLAELKEKVEAETKATIGKFIVACGNDKAFATDAYLAGKSLEVAKAEYSEYLDSNKTELVLGVIAKGNTVDSQIEKDWANEDLRKKFFGKKELYKVWLKSKNK